MTQEKKKSIGQIVLAAVTGCLVFGIMQGIHDNYGIMMKALVPFTGIPYNVISTIVGIGALVYGISQPFFGMLAVRKSNTTVMLIGIAAIAAGLLVTPLCRNVIAMLLVFGIGLPTGTGALAFGIVMGAITPVIGEKRAAGLSGIIQASAGVGDALMAPGLQALINWHGIQFGMGVFAVVILLLIPAVLWMRSLEKQHAAVSEEEPVTGSLFSIIRDAFKDDTYRKVFLAFTTCGFNMSIIEEHLFSQYVSWGIPETASSFIMTIYGVMTMLGAVAAGMLCMKFRKKSVLGSIYFMRIVISISMLFMPHVMWYAVIATALLGMSGDSTVPSTSGLISERFGSAKLGILYGFALVGHQLGALDSASLGGWCMTQYGNLTLVWIINAALALMASISSFAVHEPQTNK